MRRHNSAASDGVDHRREKIKTKCKNSYIRHANAHRLDFASRNDCKDCTRQCGAELKNVKKNTIECRTIADNNVKRHWCTRRTRIVRWHDSHAYVPFVCLRLCVRKGDFPWQHIRRIYHVLYCVGSTWSLFVQLVKPCSQNPFSFIINYAFFCISIHCRLQ